MAQTYRCWLCGETTDLFAYRGDEPIGLCGHHRMDDILSANWGREPKDRLHFELQPMSLEQKMDALVQTPEGERAFAKAFKPAFQRASSEAADHFPPGSLGEALGRALAGLPPKTKKAR